MATTTEVDTVSLANVAALATLKPRVGVTIVTRGYYADGDGGGNAFLYRPEGRLSITIDDGFYFRGPGDEDYFEAVDKSVANVLQFGAGAGQSSATNVAAVNAAIGAALHVDVPRGVTLATNGSLILRDGTFFELQGNILHSSDFPCIKLSGTLIGSFALTADATTAGSVVSLDSVAGLSAGKCLVLTDGLFGATYTISSINSLDVTLDRQLDFDVASATGVATGFSPKSGRVSGSGAIRIQTSYPTAILAQYTSGFVVDGISCESLTAFGSGDGTSVRVLSAQQSRNIVFRDVTVHGIDGGNEFEPIGTRSCSFVDVTRCKVRNCTGAAKGIYLLGSTHCDVSSNLVARVTGGGVGCIFLGYSSDFRINNNAVVDSISSVVGGGSLIQVTDASSGEIASNTVRNPSGPGGIYCSGGCADIAIAGNSVTLSYNGGADTLVGIHLRSGARITCSANTVLSTTSITAAIWVRAITDFVIASNKISIVGNAAGGHGLLLDKAGSDPDTVGNYPHHGVVSDNHILKQCNLESTLAVSMGLQSSDITFSSNRVRAISSPNSSGVAKWVAYFQGVHNDIIDNAFFAEFDLAGTNQQLVILSNTGRFQRNRLEYNGGQGMQLISATPERFGKDNLILSAGVWYGYSIFNGTQETFEVLPQHQVSLPMRELSASPTFVAEGMSAIWQSDGTADGNDGDLMATVSAGGTTKVMKLLDFATENSTPAATTASFESLSDPINTQQKYAGKMAWNSTAGKPVWSAGSAASAVWVDATGATAHTPV